jgi:hypothetical protein
VCSARLGRFLLLAVLPADASVGQNTWTECWDLGHWRFSDSTAQQRYNRINGPSQGSSQVDSFTPIEFGCKEPTQVSLPSATVDTHEHRCDKLPNDVFRDFVSLLFSDVYVVAWIELLHICVH